MSLLEALPATRGPVAQSNPEARCAEASLALPRCCRSPRASHFIVPGLPCPTAELSQLLHLCSLNTAEYLGRLKECKYFCAFPHCCSLILFFCCSVFCNAIFFLFLLCKGCFYNKSRTSYYIASIPLGSLLFHISLFQGLDGNDLE